MKKWILLITAILALYSIASRANNLLDQGQDHPDILAGRDLKGGGTWLGINRSGKISMVTNYRDPKRQLENAPTRGKLVSEFLIDSRPPRLYIQRLRSLKDIYNGYNILLGDINDLFAMFGAWGPCP